MANAPKGFEIFVASPHYYEELVVEMYYRGSYIGQINKEKGNTRLEIEFNDPPPGERLETCKRVDLGKFLKCVEVARETLTGEFR